MQNNYQNQTGNASYPVDTFASMYNPGEPPLQARSDWSDPVIGRAQSGDPYDYGQSAANGADWSAPGRAAQFGFMDPTPTQPTYGVYPGPVPTQDTNYQLMNDALGGTFTDEEINAACGCTLPTRTDKSKYLIHRSTVSDVKGHKTAKSGGRPCSVATITPVSLPPSKIATSRQEMNNTLPPSNSIPPATLTTRAERVAFGPTHDNVLRQGDNRPPRNRNKTIVGSPQDLLSLSLMTHFPPDTLKFLDVRPNPLDASMIPFGTHKTGSLIMGVFKGRVSMFYIHPAPPLSLTSVQQLEQCDKSEKDVGRFLATRGNEIINLILNSQRWTAHLPRSTVEKSNGIVTIQKPSWPGYVDPSNHYINGDTQKASLCVAAAALTTFLGMPCRPVFEKKTYDSIRKGEQQTSGHSATYFRSGVNILSRKELDRLAQVPPKWEGKISPLMWIAEQFLGDGPEVMSVDSG